MEIKEVEDLTAELFTKLLNKNWIQNGEATLTCQVESLSLERVDLGVLSQVYRVHLQYKESTSNLPPAEWLVKICRPDLNLSYMCRNEAIFYKHIAPQFSKASKFLSFSAPPFLSGDENHVILQEILNVETIHLMEGCPDDKIPVLLECLTSLHAKCWTVSNNSKPETASELLVSPPGMGQRLPPLQKEGLFVSSWKETVECIHFDVDKDADTLSFITGLCERLGKLKLRTIHKLVHQHCVTLVHGDFHVGNCLFPKNADENEPFLVDWATTGYGNPTIDLVFFLVASTNDQIVEESQQYLARYRGLLMKHRPELTDRISLETLKKWFPLALLCQWMILVAYDSVCRQIAANEPDEQKSAAQLKHFRNVNRRAVFAMKSVDNWEETLSMLEPATKEDMEEAQRFCKETPLAI